MARCCFVILEMGYGSFGIVLVDISTGVVHGP